MIGEVIKSRPMLVFGLVPSAVDLKTISRSVTTPTNRSPSQTGRKPISRTRIFRAASVKESFGWTTSTSFVMISLSFILCSFLQHDLPNSLRHAHWHNGRSNKKHLQSPSHAQ